MPNTIDCHCTFDAHKYRSRVFTNSYGHIVTRIYYRCVNCWSRIQKDYIPEIDNRPRVGVLELLEQFRTIDKAK